MRLTTGTRLGAFEITGSLGAGGMGEVYRARDTRLNRDVALKILPEVFAADPERLARFEREAQVLASLNHPHIAAIHGIEESDGVRALVLELVEGETLADRIARGPIPLNESLSIGRQVAQALEAAHEKGIVHRDLKPSNIAFTNDGDVKVLDFGLAKLIAPPGSGRQAGTESPDRSVRPPDVTASPTITSPALATGVGVLLGTAAYMSPEQAKGRDADKRSDVWAFGCVLFEMLTGLRAFEGEDVTETLAAVVLKEPDLARLPASVPPVVRVLLGRLLAKDRKHRVGDMAAVTFVLGEASLVNASNATIVTKRRWTGSRAALLAAATLMTAVIAAAFVWRSSPAVGLQPAKRVEIGIGADASIDPAQDALVLSPDGTTMAFSALAGGRRQLFVRRLDQLTATAVPGTDGATAPFFSPDGQWVGFFADGKLKKVAVSGAAPVTLCDAGASRGASWAIDDTIVFSPSTRGSLFRISSSGGKPEPLFALASDEVSQRWPQVLPGGQAVLYTSLRQLAPQTENDAGAATLGNPADVAVVVQPLAGGPRTVVAEGGFHGRYVRSGHLLYVTGTTLFAVSFDAGQLKASGSPVPVVERVTARIANTSAQFAVSDEGTFEYLPESSNIAAIDWLDRTSRPLRLPLSARDWANIAVSPDGRRLAVDVYDGKQTDIWVYEWERDTLTRLTFSPTNSERPVWTPDGRRIAFATHQGGQLNLFWQLADGTGPVQRLTDSPNSQGAWSWHPNGRVLAFHELSSALDDIYMLPIEGDEASGWSPGKPVPFVKSPFAERAPMFSPDGRWVAYQSSESGRDEIYVTGYPGPRGKWQISSDGGVTPTWSKTRRELLFARGTEIMVVPYTIEGDSFRAEKPRAWADTQLVPRQRTGPTRSFDIHPDGTRVALAAADDRQVPLNRDRVVLVSNFFDELRRLAPAK